MIGCFWKFDRLRAGLACLVTGLCLGVHAEAQVRVLIEYDGELLPVFSMDGSTPEVLVNNRPVKVANGRLRVEPAAAFTDGAIDILSRNAIMGQDYGSSLGGFFFRFEAMIEAERDFEDCFVLFVIAPEAGDPTYIVREIPDINKTGSERIAITLPVNPGFGGGTFAYRVFSRGEEIERRDGNEPLSVAKVGEPNEEVPSVQGAVRNRVGSEASLGEPASVIKERLLDFPEELLGKVTGGYATAVYSIDEQGRVIELLELTLDHAAFAPEVLRTLRGSTYRPGRYDGEALVTTVRQSFFFNEFASFSEALEMIPYPKIKDRRARAVYAPLPALERAAGGEVRLEMRVNELGLVTSSHARDTSVDEAIVALVLEKSKDWVFLPAIAGGYPVEQTVEVPVTIGRDR